MLRNLQQETTRLLSQLLSKLTISHPAVFMSNVQCVLAAVRRTLKMCCYRSRLVFNCCL